MISGNEYEQAFIDWIRANIDNSTDKTQQGLAAHLGIAHPQITQLLKGKRLLKAFEIPKIAEYLGTTPPFHFPFDDEDMKIFMGVYLRTAPKERQRMLRIALLDQQISDLSA